MSEQDKLHEMAAANAQSAVAAEAGVMDPCAGPMVASDEVGVPIVNKPQPVFPQFIVRDLKRKAASQEQAEAEIFAAMGSAGDAVDASPSAPAKKRQKTLESAKLEAWHWVSHRIESLTQAIEKKERAAQDLQKELDISVLVDFGSNEL
eukprot:14266564-Alexandrium_andersonii.AAC.1